MTHPTIPSYPVNLLVDGRPCLVVGGGRVARRKVAGLLTAGADVTVVAPLVVDDLGTTPNVRVVPRRYEQGDLRGMWLVIACTDDAAVNAQVHRDAEAAGIWSNSADDPANCAFTLPAVARQGDLSIAVSTGGQSPALASWLRQRFEREFDDAYRQLVELLADVRREVRAARGTTEIEGWTAALDDGVYELVADGRLADARARLRSHLGLVGTAA